MERKRPACLSLLLSVASGQVQVLKLTYLWQCLCILLLWQLTHQRKSQWKDRPNWQWRRRPSLSQPTTESEREHKQLIFWDFKAYIFKLLKYSMNSYTWYMTHNKTWSVFKKCNTVITYDYGQSKISYVWIEHIISYYWFSHI